MALNIKNAEVEKLASEAAELAGESKTQAIRKALEAPIRRLKLHRGGRSRQERVDASCAFPDALKADLEERRRRLERAAGLPVGPLQLIDVAEVVLALPAGDTPRKQIMELLSFVHPRAGVYALAGPAIRLIEGGRYVIDSLRIRVKSREAAERYVREHNVTFGGLKVVLQER